jgi:hypothetical protein
MFPPFSDRGTSVRLLPRWARWIVLFIAPTLLGGLLFATSDVLLTSKWTEWEHERRFMQAMHDFKDPYRKTINTRFVLGSLVGAGVGSACIAWCIIKRIEP